MKSKKIKLLQKECGRFALICLCRKGVRNIRRMWDSRSYGNTDLRRARSAGSTDLRINELTEIEAYGIQEIIFF